MDLQLLVLWDNTILCQNSVIPLCFSFCFCHICFCLIPNQTIRTMQIRDPCFLWQYLFKHLILYSDTHLAVSALWSTVQKKRDLSNSFLCFVVKQMKSTSSSLLTHLLLLVSLTLCPGIRTLPFFSQIRCGSGTPWATQVNTALPPAGLDTDCGHCRNSGGAEEEQGVRWD